MNKIIPNGSYCLFRQDERCRREGEILLVKSTHIHDMDFGSGYTVKEYHSSKKMENDQWYHQSIILEPLSCDPEFRSIELSGDELISLKVVGVFERVL